MQQSMSGEVLAEAVSEQTVAALKEAKLDEFGRAVPPPGRSYTRQANRLARANAAGKSIANVQTRHTLSNRKVSRPRTRVEPAPAAASVEE